jgi:hypothetical protein
VCEREKLMREREERERIKNICSVCPLNLEHLNLNTLSMKSSLTFQVVLWANLAHLAFSSNDQVDLESKKKITVL